MAVKVKDLKDQSGPGPHPNLMCLCCGGEYSANKGDYFMFPHNHTFKCCGEEMILAVKEVRYRRVG